MRHTHQSSKHSGVLEEGRTHMQHAGIPSSILEAIRELIGTNLFMWTNKVLAMK